MANTTIPLWQEEFGPAYACPEIPEGLTDLSWHNDAFPSFGIYDEKSGEAPLRIWIAHPDPTQREFDKQHRYLVYFYPSYGAPGPTHCVEILETDDWDAAVAAFHAAEAILESTPDPEALHAFMVAYGASR